MTAVASETLVYLGLFAVLLLLLPLWLRPIGPIPFIVSVIVVTWSFYAGHYDNYPDMPTTMFWILFFLFLPTLLLPFCCGIIFFYLLVLTNLHTISQSPLMPFLSLCFWVIFGLLLPFIMVKVHSRQYSAVICWIPIALLLRDQLHFGMSIGYWLTWPFLLWTLMSHFDDQLPVSWFFICASVVTALGLTIHPGESYIRFLVFTLSINSLLIPRILFPWVYIYPETYLFPFNLISRWYKFSSEKWYPISLRPDTSTTLCEQCQHLTASSKLIMGSYRPLVPLVEWHEISAKQTGLGSQPPCQLCHLLWHAVDDAQRAQHSDVRWKVKVWEERPLSRFTFVKLFHGDKPMGSRLLVHRRDIFGDVSRCARFPTTNSDAHINQAKSWLRECEAHHTVCRDRGRRPPTRLVYVAPASPGEPRDTIPTANLLPVDSLDSPLEYLAFSHCWGGSSAFRLQQDNYEACLESFDISKLSKNVQDAICVTRDLGYSYIWIDTLCIIQDSAEDWKLESAKMMDVYAGAVCTIASTGSSSGDGGCFHRRNPLSLHPCEVGVSSLDELDPERIYIRRDDLTEFRRGVDRAPLNKRGWVIQERLLPRRILHFGAEMIYWECCQRAASELNPTGFIFKEFPEEFYGNFIPPPIKVDPVEPKYKQWSRTEMVRRRIPKPDFDGIESSSNRTVWKGDRGFWKETRRHCHLSWHHDRRESRFRTPLDRIERSDLSSDQSGMLSFTHLWFEIVEAYTRTQVSFSTDRLIAISGIVQRIQKATGGEFVAGLWKEHLAANLLWFTSEGPGTRLLESRPSRENKDAVTEVKTVAVNGTSDDAEQSPQLGTEAHPHTGKRNPRPPPCMAPTWSWASVDGVISLDMLPDNANRKVEGETLISSCDVSIKGVELEEHGEYSNAWEGILQLTGPLSKVYMVEHKEDDWFISVSSRGSRTARFFPDLVSFESETHDPAEETLFCLSCMVLKKEEEKTLVKGQMRTEIQGVVLKRVRKREGLPDIFERVGFFTTGRMTRSSPHHKKLKYAPKESVHII